MKFILNKDTVTICDKEVINSGSVNYYEADVEYDDSWKNLNIKAVLVKNGEEEGTQAAVINNKVFIDKELSETYRIGFVGYTIENETKVYQISTNLVSFYIQNGAGGIEVVEGEIPTPTEWEIYLAQIQEIVNRISEDVINNVGEEITNKVVTNMEHVIENNLQEAKDYADGIKPTKTSELTNDSNFAKTNENNNFSTAQTINGTLTINGNIVQNGKTYETHAEKVYTKNDEIITREGAEGGLSEGEYSGIQAHKYDGKNNGRLGYNANGEARVGDVGDEQPLLTRDEIINLVDGQLLKWDATQLKAVGVEASQVVGNVKASETQSGTVKVWTSINKDGEIGLNISTEV